MQQEPEIVFNNMEKDPELESLVNRRIQKLERYCDHIASCHVAVEKKQEAVSSGSEYAARVMVRVPPKHELIGKVTEQEEGRIMNAKDAIHGAFDAAERQVKTLSSIQGGR